MSRLKQTLCYWCFDRPDLPFLKLCAEARRIGYEGLEMVPEDRWEIAKLQKLRIVTHVGHQSLIDGLNRTDNHVRIEREIRASIDKAAANDIPVLICFSGNRRGLADAEGLANTVAGLKRVAGYAEEKNVTLALELLNSRIDHKDYQCDHTAWGAEVIRQVGSMRVRLLYDVYHMQIMEGDLIRTITANLEAIGHVHVAGNPGRNDPDSTQEINYRAVMKTLAASTYFGWVGQEFVPKSNPVAALEEAFKVCDI
jgi:hydroxypyruvate isomerase